MESSQSTVAVQQEQPAETQTVEVKEEEQESILDAFPKHEMAELALQDNFFARESDGYYLYRT